MSGDKLASGGRSATFTQAAGQSDLEQDLKTQSMPYCLEHWVMTETEYKKLCLLIAKHEPLPHVERVPEPKFAVVKNVAEAVGFEDVSKPKVGYRAKPFGDSILVSKVEREHSSNLVMPDSLKAKTDLAYVTSVGDAVKNIKVGQLVMFDRFAAHGSEFNFVDEDGIERAYLLLREFDVLVQLEKVNLATSGRQ